MQRVALRLSTVPSGALPFPVFTSNARLWPSVNDRLAHAFVLPFLVESQNDRTSGIRAPHAGFGHLTVRAQSHAMTVSSCPTRPFRSSRPAAHLFRDLDLRIKMADAPLGLIAHPLSVVAHILGQPLRALPASRMCEILFRFRIDWRPSGELRWNLDKRLGDQTATGFRSLPCASSPSRCASSGIDPPPQNGSSTGGGLPSHDFKISARAAASTCSLFEFSHCTSFSIIPKSRLRSFFCASSVGNSSGWLEGSSTS